MRIAIVNISVLLVLLIMGSCEDKSEPTVSCETRLLYPDSSAVWTAGNTVTIRWNRWGDCSSGVDIDLLNEGEHVAVIAADLIDVTHYDWLVGSYDQGTDSFFTVRLSDAGESEEVESKPFVIRQGLVCNPTVVSPETGEIWITGEVRGIDWNWDAECEGSFVIELRKADEHILNIDRVDVYWEPDKEQGYNWVVTDSGRGEGSDYSIRLTHLPTGKYDDSPMFTIGYIPCSISFTSPIGGEEWFAGETQNITWTSTGTCYDQLRLRSTGWHAINCGLDQSISNTGSYTFLIDPCFPNMVYSEYRVYLWDRYWNLLAESEAFRILAPAVSPDKYRMKPSETNP